MVRRFSSFFIFTFLCAVWLAGCGTKSVGGKTYVTSDGDTIEFDRNGQAIEKNGNFGVLYAGQAVSFDSAGMPEGTPCTYKQTENKVALRCEPGMDAAFTIGRDGALEGPPEGMFQHTSFAHLTERK